jgi:hypothetical protein
MWMRGIVSLFFALACTAGVQALAHGDAAWIQSQGLQNIEGWGCCGTTDCKIADDIVRQEGGGYRILTTGEFIPFEETIPNTEDEHFWRCEMLAGATSKRGGVTRRYPEGSTRCLIVPPVGM